MAIFLDLRLQSVGGTLATSVSFFAGTCLADYASIQRSDVLNAIRGRNVLIGTHGFNVNRSDGIDCLNTWGSLLQLTSQDVFLGLLWPGDSVWAHGLDYGEEPKIADEAGELLGPFLDILLTDAASVSFASHSLGARVILQTVLRMNTKPRRLILMAGAIDDDCLTNEFKAAADKVGEISVLASQRDEVLTMAFPLGNFAAGIIDQGHPWWRGALGLNGPVQPWPGNFHGLYQIPANWAYGHHHYLQFDPASTEAIPMPVDVPGNGSGLPAQGADGWQETWSAAFASTRFRS
jgi:hypothetical protein